MPTFKNDYIEFDYITKTLKKVRSDKDFDEYMVCYVYSSTNCDEVYTFKNKKTGEILGNHLDLCYRFYDDNMNFVPTGIKDDPNDFEQIINISHLQNMAKLGIYYSDINVPKDIEKF